MTRTRIATVQKKMTTPVVSIAPDAAIDEALDRMLRHHISGIPVVDADERLLGVVSEYDLLRLACGRDTVHDPYLVCENFMTSSVITVQQTATMDDATQLLLDSGVRRLLVLDGERLVGILARREVVRHVRDQRLTSGVLSDHSLTVAGA